MVIVVRFEVLERVFVVRVTYYNDFFLGTVILEPNIVLFVADC